MVIRFPQRTPQETLKWRNGLFTGPGGSPWHASRGHTGRSAQREAGPGAHAFIRVCGVPGLVPDWLTETRRHYEGRVSRRRQEAWQTADHKGSVATAWGVHMCEGASKFDVPAGRVA